VRKGLGPPCRSSGAGVMSLTMPNLPPLAPVWRCRVTENVVMDGTRRTV
jgi:hypothetical protein